MSRPADPVLGALRCLSHAVCRHRRWFVVPQFVVFILCAWFTVAKLEFRTNRSDLVGADKKYHQIYLRFKKEFPIQDDLVVVVESESIPRNRQFVERFGSKLAEETNLFEEVFYKGDMKTMGRKALLFATEPDLEELHRALADFRPFVERFTQASNLVSLFEAVNDAFRTARNETNAQNNALVRALPALRRVVDEGTQALLLHGDPPSPGVGVLFGEGEEAGRAGYVTFAGGRIYLVTARAKSDRLNGECIATMRRLMAETQAQVPGLNVGLTGEPVLELDEMNQSRRDSTLSAVLSLIGSTLIFIYGYGEISRPLKAVFALVIGLGYTMGFTTLAVGHLNILTITFVPILIGLAIDFGVHLITRYEEELENGKTPMSAMEMAMVNTGKGIFTGAWTTATAFFAMTFTDFQGIREMGIICGGGMMLCLVPMMTVLPVLLLRGRSPKHDAIRTRSGAISHFLAKRPGTIVGTTIALCVIAAIGADRVGFDYNLLNMQSKGLAAVEYADKLIRSSDKSVLFGVVMADSVAEGRRLENRLEGLAGVSSVDSMIRFLGEDQSGKLRQVAAIKAEIGGLRLASPDNGPVRVGDLTRTLWALQGYLGLADNSVGDADPSLSVELAALRTSVINFRRSLLDGSDPSRPARAARFQRALFEDLHDTFRALAQQDAMAPLTVDDLPESLRNRFVGVTGKHLLMVYPKTNAWERGPQEAFVRELRSVDPNATGTPVQLYEYTSLLRTSYEKAACYALGAISVMVLLHFKSPVCVLLSLIPVGIGFFLMVGIMGFHGTDFNPANIMTLPLVVGIGVTNGIHILNRVAEEQNPAILGKSTGKAVLVSGLTTIAGFGSLVFADHRGISSLGFTMFVGVTACMVAGLTFLPALLHYLERAGWRIGRRDG